MLHKLHLHLHQNEILFDFLALLARSFVNQFLAVEFAYVPLNVVLPANLDLPDDVKVAKLFMLFTIDKIGKAVGLYIFECVV